GPFSAIWLAWNWRMVSVLFLSTTKIEERILFIDENYINIWDLLFWPLIGAVIFALIVPWATLLIQRAQDAAHILRKKGRLDHDAEFLRASVAKAEAQAALNRILAQDEITRRQQEELDQIKMELVKERNMAASKIAEVESKLEQKRQEYESRSDKSGH